MARLASGCQWLDLGKLITKKPTDQSLDTPAYGKIQGSTIFLAAYEQRVLMGLVPAKFLIVGL